MLKNSQYSILNLIREKSFNRIKLSKKPKFFYAFRFSSIFYPGSFKNITLLIKASSYRDDTMSDRKHGTFKNTKILVKQSYLLAVWMHYLSKSTSKSLDSNDEVKDIPSFFVHPYNQSKLTILKAPLAHKTFSQEQFLTRYYTITVSFKPNLSFFSTESESVSSVNSSFYVSHFVRSNIPFISTNMLFLKRISYAYGSHDTQFFSYLLFSKRGRSYLNIL